MTIKSRTRGYMVAAGLVAMLGLGVSALPAAAQDYGPDNAYGSDDVVGGITVFAPPYHQRDTATGASIDTVSASRVVYFRDLDPSTTWGSHVLRMRIEHAARDACDEIDTKYPLADNFNDNSCVSRAVDRAMYRVARMTDASYGDWDNR